MKTYYQQVNKFKTVKLPLDDYELLRRYAEKRDRKLVQVLSRAVRKHCEEKP